MLAFHETALKLGATDAGAAGVRPLYTARFYRCFVLGPDGFKIEAVVGERLQPIDRKNDELVLSCCAASLCTKRGVDIALFTDCPGSRVCGVYERASV